MGILLVRGRALERGDSEGGPPVIVINETLARRYFADENPIGEYLIFKLDPDGDEIEHEIAGVARDITNWGFNEGKWPRIYAPFVQAPTAFMNVVVRTRGAPLEAVPALRAEFASIDPSLALFQFESMTDRMQRSKWQQRLFAVLMIALGMLALVLASVGVLRRGELLDRAPHARVRDPFGARRRALGHRRPGAARGPRPGRARPCARGTARRGHGAPAPGDALRDLAVAAFLRSSRWRYCLPP